MNRNRKIVRFFFRLLFKFSKKNSKAHRQHIVSTTSKLSKTSKTNLNMDENVFINSCSNGCSSIKMCQRKNVHSNMFTTFIQRDIEENRKNVMFALIQFD